jgi:Histidine kinase-, DNA gyrase B-, and HSP90-like ATPase
MSVNDRFIECLPDPARVAEGLRDTGYEFDTAVADIVDNCIAAGADFIDVQIGMDPKGNVVVGVMDDGRGMDRDGLINALRYGSKKRDDPSSLGKFGLGLKTASTAFCRRVSLISRPSEDSETLKASWDLDAVVDHGWRIEIVQASKYETDLLDKTAKGNSGTLVLWEKVDRLLSEYKTQGGASAKKALKKCVDGLSQHLSMVYQRFLDAADDRERTLELRLQGEKVQPWDPFCIAETGEPIATKELSLELEDGTKTKFLVRAFVLPRKEDFTDQQAARVARISNDMQGIFVYRENRLIHGPDWMDMYRKEPHFSNCRVELSFNHTLDDAFQVDIKKSRILLANEIYDWLRDKFLPGPRREAEMRYRKGQTAIATGAGALLHSSSNNAIHAKADTLKTANLEEYDAKTGVGTIRNKSGQTKIKIKLVEPESPGQVHVKAVPEILNGLLFEPTYILGNQGVQINTSHPYYHKVYLPNSASGVTIQGLDSLLWALCAAELGCVSDDTKRKFEEMRFEVSRLLRQLVEDMPDAPEATE